MSCRCEPGATLRRLFEKRHPDWFRPENYVKEYPRDGMLIREASEKDLRIAELEATIRRLKARAAQPIKGDRPCPK